MAVATDVNPRYLAYCHAEGKTVEEARAERTQVGFLLWMSARKTEFCAEHDIVDGRLHARNQEVYTRWLTNWSPS